MDSLYGDTKCWVKMFWQSMTSINGWLICGSRRRRRRRRRRIFDNNLTSTSQNRRLIGSLRPTVSPAPPSQTIPAIAVNDVLLRRTDDVAKRIARLRAGLDNHAPIHRHRADDPRPVGSQPLISLGSPELVVLQRGSTIVYNQTTAKNRRLLRPHLSCTGAC